MKVLLRNDGRNEIITLNGGWAPLHEVCDQGYSQIVNLLVENWADPNVLTNRRDTPLHLCCREGYLNITQMLLDLENINVLIENGLGRTPLNDACRNNNIEVVKLMLENEKVLKGDKLLERKEGEWKFQPIIVKELRKGKNRRKEL
jgi:ankyrin repeat protein